MESAPAAAPAVESLPGPGTQELAAQAENVPLTAPPVPAPCDQVRVTRASKTDWLGMGMMVALDDDVEFDTDASRGQIREIQPDLLARLRRDFEMSEPIAPLHSVLVACDAAGVLGLSLFRCRCFFFFQFHSF